MRLSLTNILFTAAASKGPREKEGEAARSHIELGGEGCSITIHPLGTAQLRSMGMPVAPGSCLSPATTPRGDGSRLGQGLPRASCRQEVMEGKGGSVSASSSSSLLCSQPSPIHLAGLKPN